MAKRIWQGVQPGFYAGIANLIHGEAYEISDEQYEACPDYWGSVSVSHKAEVPAKKEAKEVTE